MTIAYPLSLPSATQFMSVHFDMIDAVGVSESPFTFSQEVFENDGKRWEASVQVQKLNRAGAEAWIAFLASLDGRKGTFLMGDPAAATARGTLGGTPVVDGASQTGQVLNVRGLSTGITNWARAGDYFQLGSGLNTRLYKILADVNSDGSGKLALDIWPTLRSSPGDGDALTMASALGLWRLAANRRGWDTDTAIHYGINFAAVEAL